MEDKILKQLEEINQNLSKLIDLYIKSNVITKEDLDRMKVTLTSNDLVRIRN
jgi:hypothetical protein